MVRTVAARVAISLLAGLPGCSLLDGDEQTPVWNTVTETLGPDVELLTETCVPIAGGYITEIEGGASGTGYAEYFHSVDGRLYWAYYIAPAGEPAWFVVTPETGELAAEFEFDNSSFDETETVTAEIETHYGSQLEILFWSADCEEDPEPPTDSE